MRRPFEAHQLMLDLLKHLICGDICKYIGDLVVAVFAFYYVDLTEKSLSDPNRFPNRVHKTLCFDVFNYLQIKHERG